MTTQHAKLRVAIASSSERQRNNLKTLLEKNGLRVVADQAPGEQFLDLIDTGRMDVLLIDLDDDAEQESNFVNALLERSRVPVLFNDSASTRLNAAAYSDWGRTLAHKLSALVREHAAIEARMASTEPMPVITASAASPPVSAQHAPVLPEAPISPPVSTPAAPKVQSGVPAAGSPPAAAHFPIATSVAPPSPRRADKGVRRAPAAMPAGAAQRVWVLGASIGGPQALKAFLSAVTAELPVAFIVAQHIGAGFAELLAEQLGSIASFKVFTAQSGHVLRHGQVVLAPVDQQLAISAQGKIELRPVVDDGGLYRPSIDAVMFEVAARYGARAGAVMFSGMGDDGLKGCLAIAEQGGVVWAQDAASCMISSMPDNARKAGCVSYSGTPRALAEQLAVHLQHVTTPAPDAAVADECGKYSVDNEECAQ
ncbi:MAG: chemotaxis protein CheB [Pseudomonadota bacterium]